jgi:hypothetical protein
MRSIVVDHLKRPLSHLFHFTSERRRLRQRAHQSHTRIVPRQPSALQQATRRHARVTDDYCCDLAPHMLYGMISWNEQLE